VVGDFFQQTIAAGLIDGAVEFPFARPTESILEPLIKATKEWLSSIFEGLFGKRSTPPPQRDAPAPRYEPPPERSAPGRPLTKEQLQNKLRQIQEE
jgi:hypothetical protein